jgi:hypothetical protein
MVRYADKYDPIAPRSTALSGAPSPLAEHVERTLDGSSRAPYDERSGERPPDQAGPSVGWSLSTTSWHSRRRHVAPATVRPYLLEPSLQTHALYLIGFDEERGALRTFKIERIRSAALTPRTFEPPDPAETTSALRAAWDIIADQPPVEVVLRFAPGVEPGPFEATHPEIVETAGYGSLR